MGRVDETSPETLQIKVMDDDYGKAELIGDLTLDVKTIMEKGQMLNQWMPLDKSKNGEVLVSTEYNAAGASGFNIERDKYIDEVEARTSISFAEKEASKDTSAAGAAAEKARSALCTSKSEVTKTSYITEDD